MSFLRKESNPVRLAPTALTRGAEAAVRQYRGAEAAVRQYREVKPFYPETDLYPMGRLDAAGGQRLREGNLSEAIEIFQLNVEAFPESVYTHGSLADAYTRAGNEAGAAEHYRRILEIDPSHAEAKKRLGTQ